jgi:hypothetical protein
MLPYLACPALRDFPHYLITARFAGKDTERKMRVSISSTTRI